MAVQIEIEIKAEEINKAPRMSHSYPLDDLYETNDIDGKSEVECISIYEPDFINIIAHIAAGESKFTVYREENDPSYKVDFSMQTIETGEEVHFDNLSVYSKIHLLQLISYETTEKKIIEPIWLDRDSLHREDIEDIAKKILKQPIDAYYYNNVEKELIEFAKVQNQFDDIFPFIQLVMINKDGINGYNLTEKAYVLCAYKYWLECLHNYNFYEFMIPAKRGLSKEDVIWNWEDYEDLFRFWRFIQGYRNRGYYRPCFMACFSPFSYPGCSPYYNNRNNRKYPKPFEGDSRFQQLFSYEKYLDGETAYFANPSHTTLQVYNSKKILSSFGIKEKEENGR